VLEHSGDDHGDASDTKTGRDSLDGCEVESRSAETGVDDSIKDGDEDDQGERVEVIDNIVGDTAELHGGGLRCKIVQHLVVGKPWKRLYEHWYGKKWTHRGGVREEGPGHTVERVPQEHLARFQTTGDFVDPLIIESHPLRLVRAQGTWLDRLPERLGILLEPGFISIVRPKWGK
jgi:hypothetical protein